MNGVPRKLLLVPDYAEENWPSMDLCAEMLAAELRRRQDWMTDVFQPRFVKRFVRVFNGGTAHNADRLINRLRDYPRQLRRVADQHDVFHLVDHSYSQLLHELPAGRAGVFCHDLDTFQCLLDPTCDQRPWWFKKMARRILRGMQRAAVVFHSTDAVRRLIVQHRLIDPSKLVQTPLGIAPEFCMAAAAADLSLPGLVRDEPFLLHVGSTIPRKRIDVLLDICADVMARRPEIRLVKVGGDWVPQQQKQIDRLGIRTKIVTLGLQPRATVAELYRRAEIVLMPSESEGFGLPVAEALACGAVVIASDIPPLREVGGDAAIYCKVADVAAWSQAVLGILSKEVLPPSRNVRLVRASRYSWSRHAATILDAYARLT